MLFSNKKVGKKLKNYKTGYNKLAYSASQSAYNNDTSSANKYHSYLNQEGYILDNDFDGRQKVYHNPNTKHTIIGFKGTTNREDIDADVNGIGLNNFEQDSFKKAYEVSDKVKGRYGENILYTGHSLGGSLSLKAAERNNSEGSSSIGFNSGTSPLYEFKVSGKHKLYRHQDDLVSASATGNVENVVQKKKATYNLGSSNPAIYAITQNSAHSLNGFDEEFF